MNFFFLKRVFLILIIFLIYSVAQCSSKKVYSISGDKFFNWMLTKGYSLVSKPLTNDASCMIENNILTVKIKENSSRQRKPVCQFSLFNGTILAKHWRVHTLEVISNGLGQWRYIKSPKGKSTLTTVIHANYNGKKQTGSHKIKIKKIILAGPASSSSWKQAILP